MKLWILRPTNSLREFDPWFPHFDKVFAFVMCAETEADARKMAHADAGNENTEWISVTVGPWLDAEFSTCEELIAGTAAEIVVRDFASTY